MEVYKCEMCNGEFEKGLSDQEAAKKAKERFGIQDVNDPNVAIICDDCFKKLGAFWSKKVIKEL